MRELIVDTLYIVASVLFILGIKRMSRVKTARRANQLSAVGMALAIVAVVVDYQEFHWWVLVAGLGTGTVLGIWIARVVLMTQMPEMVAALNGFGGAASALVGNAFLLLHARGHATSLAAELTFLDAMMYPLTILVGWITFSGSAVAYFKLSGRKLVHPLKGGARHQLHVVLLLAALALSAWMMYASTGLAWTAAAVLLSALSLALGWLLVVPIGGADMPVVVSLLNSYSGIAGALSGFVVKNPLLVVAGCLVGSSGVILSQIMCKAMNRSLRNVLMGGMGDDAVAKGDETYQGVKSTSAEEVAVLFDGAREVIFAPGYGLAVAQAQHAVRELAGLLEKRGTNVRFAIHPVAGRMPGHMNVLLAEAEVPYEKLFEMDKINAEFKNCDVAIVVGANDVVNPAAKHDPKSPIAGMPILNVDEARTVVVIKRKLAGVGYAGIKNPLFEQNNCLMLFQDAKVALQDLITEVKAL